MKMIVWNGGVKFLGHLIIGLSCELVWLTFAGKELETSEINEEEG